ncbi:MAG: aspartate-semialdehyde dehydrogenase [Eubacteriales bacterium]|nr:aspartate-semialdehyde dehydrogenase [Eubacteriales bacterium]
MMKVAILGASGIVGMQMLKCIEERNIDCELVLLASNKSKGKEVYFKNKKLIIEEVSKESFNGIDYVLGAVSSTLSKEYLPYIKESKAIFIDNSNAFRMNEDVPLVVPEINKDDIKLQKGIIANPNCSTIIACMAIYAINKISEIEKMIVSTYQAVSGAGIFGIKELEEEINDISKKQEIQKKDDATFPYQIASNLIPSIGNPLDNLYTSEEMKMQNEGRKIMHLPNLKVTCTCVRVPVIRSHSLSISLETKEKLSIDKIREAISKFDGVHLVDDLQNNKYPMPLDTTDKDFVEVGRIREDLVFENGISLWACGDQVRKGAATNAIQILEECIKQKIK